MRAVRTPGPARILICPRPVSARLQRLIRSDRTHGTKHEWNFKEAAMSGATKYKAKLPDKDGIIPYTDEENGVWRDLYARQIESIRGRACQEFIDGLEILDLPADRIPQPKEISAILRERTGWEVAPVPALINFDRVFKLLSEKKFPAASFIRTRESMDYLQEPDIFHEIFEIVRAHV